MSNQHQSNATIHLDAVVIGAGLSGIAALYRLRKSGWNVKAFEAGSGFGGVWHWNRYPGARVDSEYPLYQLNIPEAHQRSDWDWEYKFPGQKELTSYFNHLDKVLNLSKDVYFNSEVTSVRYNSTDRLWTVITAQRTATCKYLALAAGALHRTHLPDFRGLNNFEGKVYHTASWPEDLNLQGKRVAVIGAGATGVQVVQELAKQVNHLLVCVRNPSYCLPMGQRKIGAEEKVATRAHIQDTLSQVRDTIAGYPVMQSPGNLWDRSPEEREALWEKLYAQGGFSFLQGNYVEMLVDPKANREIYNFWAKKTRARVTDPVKKDIIAPLEPPYPFGTRRTPLEQDYYECLNQSNVELIHLRDEPIAQFNKRGLLTQDGKQKDFDFLILATGFDSFTGS
jgi:cation diffusion facilitator CzcD-associated flavoprotein CzcO